jgi:hypothetical protein
MATKEKQPRLRKGGVEEKKIFSAMAKLQKYPNVREIFKESASLYRSRKIKSISEISKNRKIINLVKKLNHTERKMYKKHLNDIGFPSLTEFVMSVRQASVALRQLKSGKTVVKKIGDKKDEIKQGLDRFGEKITDRKFKKSPILETLNKHIKYLGDESFFQKAHKAAKQQSIVERSEKSIEFYQDYAIDYGMNFNFRDMLREGGIKRSNFLLGRMYFYRYLPEPEQIRSTYDMYPLMFIMSKSEDHFEGINFHYMKPKHRAALLENMFAYLNKQDYTRNTRILFNSFIKVMRNNRKFKYAKFAYRQYRFNSISSKVVEVHPLDWEIAMSVPTEKFYSANKRRLPTEIVWKQTEIRVKRNK